MFDILMLDIWILLSLQSHGFAILDMWILVMLQCRIIDKHNLVMSGHIIYIYLMLYLFSILLLLSEYNTLMLVSCILDIISPWKRTRTSTPNCRHTSMRLSLRSRKSMSTILRITVNFDRSSMIL
jgi:hypothetical protein